jgi:pimeloyl-ACP methyl ester carboxylesterase
MEFESLLSCFPERVLQLRGGARVAVRERGTPGGGVTLFLLHGISSGAASWAQALPQEHVVAWDAPGYGLSTPLADPEPTAADYAQRLHETLQVLEIDRCVLVGHSLGALTACAYAARFDKIEVARLVLISPSRGYGHDVKESARVRRTRSQALSERGVAGLASDIDQRLVSTHASSEAREMVRWNASRLHAQGYLQAVHMLTNSSLTELPAALPVEVHCGDADVVTPPISCEQTARELNAWFGTISGAGHASPAEQPGIVADILRAAAKSSEFEVMRK